MRQEIFGVALGALLLYIFYRAIENEWPESYYPVSNTLDRAIASSPLHSPPASRIHPANAPFPKPKTHQAQGHTDQARRYRRCQAWRLPDRH